MRIEDGAGGGFGAKVNAANQLWTMGNNLTLEQFVNHDQGRVFSLPFDAIDPTSTDDKFMYIKNTGVTTEFVVTAIRVSSTTAGFLRVKRVTGTASAVAAVAPVPRNLASVRTLSAIIGTSSDITGLSDDGTLMTETLSANTFLEVVVDSGIIITPGTAIALEWSPNDGILTGVNYSK